MSQPCGKVCSMPGRYSIYLRSSPFTCIVDTLSILVRLAYSMSTSLLSKNRPFYTSLRYITEERFDSDVVEINKAKGTAWIRWLCFILGPLPQAIRLASFKGVQGTKIVGFGFLSSWLLVEFLVLIAARTARDAPPNWPSDAFEVIDAIAFFSVLASTTFVESIMLLIQLELHIFAALADLSFTHSWVLTLLICLFFFFTIGVYSALLSLLSALAHRGFSEHLGLAETFLVAFRERDGESLKVDRVAIWCLGCFVIHLAACFMLYGYSGMYNPSGTVNPGWTGVFG
jgi:hypothetical protein